MSGEGFRLAKELQDPDKRAERMARIEELEFRVYERASQVVQAALRFHEVTPTQTEPPQQWVDEFGQEGANQLLGVAKAAWLPQSLAPAALKIAVSCTIGIRRGQQRNERLGLAGRELPVKMALPQPTTREHPGLTVYPVKDLDE
jgi:hypothetical protein